MDALLTIVEDRVIDYCEAVTQAVRKLRALGLDEEAAALRDFAAGRVEAARRQAAATDPVLAEIADLAHCIAA